MTAVRALAALLVVAGLFVVVIVAHQEIGWINLIVMLLGLLGLIGMLALYNRRYR